MAGIVDVLVIMRALQEVVVVRVLVQRLGHLRHAPIVIAVFQRHGDGLAALRGRDVRRGLRLALGEGGKEAALLVNAVERRQRSQPPRQNGGLRGVFADAFVGFFRVEIGVAFGVGVGNKRRGMVADHPHAGAAHRGVARHPAALLVHANVGAHHVKLAAGREQKFQRMLGAISVPQAVINIEVVPVGSRAPACRIRCNTCRLR